jgi:hypothetical protein
MSQILDQSRHSPRQILDLPEEILQKILAYCCSDQDLAFLLWSCRLVTVKDQFCHECYHCTLCHGHFPISSSSSSSSSTTVSNSHCRVQSTTSASQPGRRRRRRLPSSLLASDDGGANLVVVDHGSRGFEGLDLACLLTGVRRCPWNNHQRWKKEKSNGNSNNRIGVPPPLPPPLLSPSSTPQRSWSLFGKMFSSALAARKRTTGMVESGRTVGAGNGDPVAHVPGG